MAHIPLYGRRGVIRGYALVDEADFEVLSEKRWNLSNAGYAIDRYKRLMHRQIMGLAVGDPLTVDHINGATLDNRRANLRVCEHADNRQNCRGGNRGSTSSYRGVSLDRKTKNHRKVWIAQVMMRGRNHFLGRFETEEEAAAVAAAFRREHMPFSSRDQPGMAVV